MRTVIGSHGVGRLVVGAVLALAACTPQFEDEAAGPPGARIELVYGAERVTFVRATALSETPTEFGLPDELGTDVRWEFKAATGGVVGVGSAPDGRQVSVETLSGETTMMGDDLKAGAAPLTVELPNADGTLRVFESDGTLIGEVAVTKLTAEDAASGKSDIDFSTDVIGRPGLAAGDGAAQGRFNVLLVPEGFTLDQLPAFHAEVKRLANALLTGHVFKDHAGLINLWTQDIKSAQSGVSDPRIPAEANLDTAFNLTWGDGASIPRRCLMPSFNWNAVSVSNLTRLRQLVNADVVVIVANETESSGCARASDRLITQSMDFDAPETLLHELGHALFGLADEYTEGGRSCGFGPNLTSNLSVIPWQDLIQTGTPIPTRSGTTGVVGAFEGGGYCATGVWRPEHTCMMKDVFASFCAVCSRIVKQRFAALGAATGGGGGGGGGGGTQCVTLLSQAVEASGNDGNLPTNVLDNNAATRWSANGSGQWIQIDLGSIRPVSAVDIAWYKGDQRRSRYVITATQGLGTETSSFATLASGQSSGTTSGKERVTFPLAHARHVRITVNGNSVNSWASIADLGIVHCQ